MQVADAEATPHKGQIVCVLQGRDEGQLAVIISVLDERFVYIADGDKRKFDTPKKKNIRHLKYFEHISPVVIESLEETGRVTNGKLRFVLNQFRDQFEVDQEKGE